MNGRIVDVVDIMSYLVESGVAELVPEPGSVFRTLGKDPIEGELGCGFIAKRFPHGHSNPIVFRKYGALLVIQGSGQYRDEEGIDLPIYPGAFVQRLPGKVHYTPVDPDKLWIECFVTFGTGFYNSLVKLGCLDPDRPVLYPGITRALVSRFRDIRTRLEAAHSHELPRILLDIQALLFQIVEMDQQDTEPSWQLVGEACRLLEKDLEKRRHVAELVESLGLGYESFRKHFRKHMGVSPNEYRVRCRIDRARTFLLQPRQSIKEIAFDLGYADSFTFSRQFKRVTGLSPTEFRQLH